MVDSQGHYNLKAHSMTATGHIATVHFATSLLFLCGWGLGFYNRGFREGVLGVYMIVVWVLGSGVREIFGSGKV